MSGSNRQKDAQQDRGDAPARPAVLPPRPGSYSVEELAELERQERLGGWLLLFFAGAAIATAVLAFYIFSDDLEQNEEYVRVGGNEPAEESNTPFVWGQEEPASTETPEPTANSVERAAVQPRRYAEEVTSYEENVSQTFNFPGPPDEEAGPTFAGPPAGSVDRETSRALRSGKAQLWQEEGERGYVLVSGTVSYGARECRQISYTRFEQGRQATSPTTQWCRLGKSGKWRPDPRGPE